MIMLCFCAETRSVVIYSYVFCNYYLFLSTHEIHLSRTEVSWVCVIVAYGPLFFLSYTVYTHIRHNLSRLYILSNIRTILYITGSIFSVLSGIPLTSEVSMLKNYERKQTDKNFQEKHSFLINMKIFDNKERCLKLRLHI